MIISDVINLAKYSELSGTAVKNNDDVIVAFLNLGLLELYKRFPIKVEEYVIELVEGTVFYTMPTNLMYPLNAFGEAPSAEEDPVQQLAINDSDAELSIFFSDWRTVNVPSNIIGSSVSILYVASPNSVTTEQALDGVTVLELPNSLVDCLLSYIGYKAYLGIKSDAGSENNAHWQRFERDCKKAEELGVAYPIEAHNMSTRVYQRGFL